MLELVQEYIKNSSTTYLLLSTGGTILFIHLSKKWLQSVYTWSKSPINGPFPLPLIGNLYGLLTKGLNIYCLEGSRKYGKTFLFWEGMSPQIVTSDIDLLKAITIRDFKIFSGRRTGGFEDVKPFRGQLTIIKDEEWKNVRSIVTTAFTSGKLKIMSPLLKQICDNVVSFLDKKYESNEDIDISKLYASFATDAVISNFFGVPIDTINEPDHPLPKNIAKVMNFDVNWRMLLYIFFPTLCTRLMKRNLFYLFDSNALNYIESLSQQIIEERKSGKVKRNDFIQMMIDHSEEDYNDDEVEKHVGQLKKTLTDEEILAQAMVFMMVGTETTAVALSWLSYNLANNPEEQDKLIEEIDSVIEKYGEISYEAVSDMPYLADCISETQRMFNVSQGDRIANEDYVYKGIKIKKGQVVNLSFYALAHDEELYPEPEKFKPERERNSDKFMPFGHGPRICIAQRFALLEIKLCAVSILAKYRFVKSEKTFAKPEIDGSGLTKPKNTLYLKVAKRNDKNNF